MSKYSLGYNWNGTQTIVSADDNELVMADIQTARANQAILDGNKEFRAQGRHPNRAAHGRLAARIPITLYQTWKKDWKMNHSDKWTWKTFLSQKINNRDYSHLKTNEMNL